MCLHSYSRRQLQKWFWPKVKLQFFIIITERNAQKWPCILVGIYTLKNHLDMLHLQKNLRLMFPHIYVSVVTEVQ